MSFDQATRELIKNRDGDRSALTGIYIHAADTGYSIHHRLLRSRGGHDTPDNGVALTGTGTTGEHGRIHANPEIATALGYMVPTGIKPSEWPIYRLTPWGFARVWHLQRPDGQLAPIPDDDAVERIDIVLGRRAAITALEKITHLLDTETEHA